MGRSISNWGSLSACCKLVPRWSTLFHRTSHLIWYVFTAALWSTWSETWWTADYSIRELYPWTLWKFQVKPDSSSYSYKVCRVAPLFIYFLALRILWYTSLGKVYFLPPWPLHGANLPPSYYETTYQIFLKSLEHTVNAELHKLYVWLTLSSYNLNLNIKKKSYSVIFCLKVLGAVA